MQKSRFIYNSRPTCKLYIYEFWCYGRITNQILWVLSYHVVYFQYPHITWEIHFLKCLHIWPSLFMFVLHSYFYLFYQKKIILYVCLNFVHWYPSVFFVVWEPTSSESKAIHDLIICDNIFNFRIVFHQYQLSHHMIEQMHHYWACRKFIL